MIVATANGFAQQLPLYSQYMFNPYLINPAFAGSLRYTPVNVGIRSQWVGFEGAPKTQVVSANGLKGDKHGLGGFLFKDKTGPLSRTGIQASYSYHIQLWKEGAKLALGAAGLVYQNVLDKTTLTSDLTGDVALQGGREKSITPDASFGAYFYHNKYFAGISVPHLLQSDLKTSETGSKLNNLTRHYFATAGYRYSINYDFMVEPSVLVKAVGGAPAQFDINAKAFYQKMIWAGISYRLKDAVVAMLGVNRGSLSGGYSYDFTLSNVKNVSSGSHEIFLAYNFGITRHKPSSRPATLPDPEKKDEEKKDGEIGPDDKKQPDVGPDDKKPDDQKPNEEKPQETKPEDKKAPEVGPKTTKGGKKKL